MESIQTVSNIINSFGINAKCVNHKKIRNISLYDLQLDPGTKIQSLHRFSEEMALAFKAKNRLNFSAQTISGIVQMEVVESSPIKINLLKELYKAPPSDHMLPIYLGSSIRGNDIWTDLSKNPHILIGGTTGSGKSVMLQTIVANLLLMSNSYIVLIDTKDLEFNRYEEKFHNIKTYRSYNSACSLLHFLLKEMEERYDHVRRGGKLNTLQPVVLIIDEFADLIMQDEEARLYSSICRLAQKCRGANMYCIIATQRPSVNIIGGVIKANFPSRIAFKVASKTDSRVLLDKNGAEGLVGNGDAIINNYEHSYVRFQAAYCSQDEIFNGGE